MSKNKFNKNIIILFLMTIIIVFANGCAGDLSSENSITHESQQEVSTTNKTTENDQEIEDIIDEKTYEYDALQRIFMEITINTTPEELEKLISQYKLYFTIEEYNQSSKGKAHTYKIAYTEGAAKQKYADSGDYIKVSFDNGNGDKLKTAQYVNSQNISYSALLYNYGTWWDFSDNNAEDYSGYYVCDSFGDKKGIIIKYANGNEKESNYFRCDSAKEAINKVIDNLNS